jgi:hypothetical protein
MALDTRWKIILCFAVTGFLTCILAAFCMDFEAPNLISNSPGLWLFFQRVWGSIPFENGALAMWSSFGIAAIANGLLYAIAGAVIAGLRQVLEHKDAAK